MHDLFSRAQEHADANEIARVEGPEELDREEMGENEPRENEEESDLPRIERHNRSLSPPRRRSPHRNKVFGPKRAKAQKGMSSIG